MKRNSKNYVYLWMTTKENGYLILNMEHVAAIYMSFVISMTLGILCTILGNCPNNQSLLNVSQMLLYTLNL